MDRARAVSPEPSLLAHTSSESRVTFRQKARSLDPLNGWACAVEICHDGMLKDTNSLDGAQLVPYLSTALTHFDYGLLDVVFIFYKHEQLIKHMVKNKNVSDP